MEDNTIKFRGTTILGVKKNGITAIAGDGQVTFGQATIMKQKAKKVRRLHNDKLPDLPVQWPMRSRCLRSLKQNCKNLMAIFHGQRSN